MARTCAGRSSYAIYYLSAYGPESSRHRLSFYFRDVFLFHPLSPLPPIHVGFTKDIEVILAFA